MASLPTDLVIIRQLVRNGTLSKTDIDQMAADIEREGDADRAHQVRCCYIDAMAPSEAEWRRDNLKVFDGGNSDN